MFFMKIITGFSGRKIGRVLSITALVLLIIALNSNGAIEKKRIAILPLEVYSSSDISALKKSISSMLATRLMEKGPFDVVDPRRVEADVKLPEAGWDERSARESGKNFDADLVIWGSITRLGNAISVDLYVCSTKSEEKWAFSEQAKGDEEVLDIIASISTKIITAITGKKEPLEPSPKKAEHPFVKSEKKETSFRKAQEPFEGQIPSSFPLERNTYFLCIADMDGDRRDEIVLAEEKGVSVYTPSGRRLIPVYTYLLPDKELKPIALTCSDENKNGFPEIYLTAGKEVIYMDRKDTIVYSYILEIREGKLVLVAKDLPFFIRALNGENGKALLLGQEKGDWDPYYGNIFSLKWLDGRLRRENLPQLKNMARLYGFLLHPDEADVVILIDEEGSVAAYELSTEKMIYRFEGNLGKFDRLTFQQKLKEERFVYGFHTKQTSYPVYVQRRMIYKKEYSDQFFTIDAKRKRVTLLGASGEDAIVGLQFKDGRIIETYRSKTTPRYILDFAFGDIAGKGKEAIWALTRDDEGRYFLELIAD